MYPKPAQKPRARLEARLELAVMRALSAGRLAREAIRCAPQHEINDAAHALRRGVRMSPLVIH